MYALAKLIWCDKKPGSQKRNRNEKEKSSSSLLDVIGHSRIEITGEEKDRGYQNIESIKANDWCGCGQGTSTGCQSRYAGLMFR
jgi:hypothetical protein